MTDDDNEKVTETENEGFLWKEIKSLIDILQNLQLQLASKMLERRTTPTGSASAKGQEIDIARTLKDYIDTNLNDQLVSQAPPEIRLEASPTLDEEELAPEAESEAKSPVSQALQANKLSEHLKDRGANRQFKHHLANKMRNTALGHLNKAIQLAKAGNREGAYNHAEYAENAVRIALDHMSESEYEIFQNELLERVGIAKESLSAVDLSDIE